ncbi:MAG: hypothetical protein JXB36_21300 [Gammaproteobacteria bacterium]|nr:hypothetical protein [Gammaproteobacteria bacterium]
MTTSNIHASNMTTARRSRFGCSAPLATLTAATLLAAAAAPLLVEAQQPDVPDLAGKWFPDYCIPDGLTCPFDVEKLKLAPRAVEFMQNFDEAISPKYDCVPATVPSLIADPYVWRIEQRSHRVDFFYEKDGIHRVVWLDGRSHPPASERSVQGHSIGRYENGALVVETSNFTYDPIGFDDMTVLPSSTLKVVTERYRREGDRLIVDLTVEDPLYLEEPAVTRFEWEATDFEMLPYECDPVKARQPLEFLPE